MTAFRIRKKKKKGQSDTGKEREGKREKVCKFDYINTFPLHSFIYNKYIYSKSSNNES